MRHRFAIANAFLALFLAGPLACSENQSVKTGGRSHEGASPGSSELGGSSWRLVRYQGGDGTTLAPEDKSKYTVAFGTDGMVRMRVDCNRGRGTWKSVGPNQLEFTAIALTRGTCSPAPLNVRIAKDWPDVNSFTRKQGNLLLSLTTDAGTYEFEPTEQ